MHAYKCLTSPKSGGLGVVQVIEYDCKLSFYRKIPGISFNLITSIPFLPGKGLFIGATI